MDHAFTDQMVRNDKEDLTSAALEYLSDYKGNFQPLLDARNAIIAGHVLNVAEIRMVLNVMRADTSIRLEYQPPDAKIFQFPKRGHTVIEDEDRPQPRTYKTFPVRGRIKSRYVFGISMHKTALNVHYIDHSRTKFIYKEPGAQSYSRSTGWRQLWEYRIEIEHSWECSSKNPQVRLLTGAEGIRLVSENVMKMCPTCLTLRTKDALGC